MLKVNKGNGMEITFIWTEIYTVYKNITKIYFSSYTENNNLGVFLYLSNDPY